MSGTSTITLGLNQTLRIEFEGRDFAYHVLCMNDETDEVDVVLGEAFTLNTEKAVKGLIGSNPTIAMLDGVAAATTAQIPHMKPTMKLRWFIPTEYTGEVVQEGPMEGNKISRDGTPILQQWWTDDHQATGEWVTVDSVRD